MRLAVDKGAIRQTKTTIYTNEALANRGMRAVCRRGCSFCAKVSNRSAGPAAVIGQRPVCKKSTFTAGRRLDLVVAISTYLNQIPTEETHTTGE